MSEINTVDVNKIRDALQLALTYSEHLDMTDSLRNGLDRKTSKMTLMLDEALHTISHLPVKTVFDMPGF